MKKNNRRKFLFAGLSLAVVGATFRFVRKAVGNVKQNSPSQPIRFLTQDGRLVEIEANKIPTTKKTASKHDVQNWVTKNKAL